VFIVDQETTQLFASFSTLGLQQSDDIDALIVFDTDANAEFGGSDQVLFSLKPESPSLGTIPGASAAGAAADVFSVTPGQSPAVFALAADFGLGHVQDNIDALSYTLQSDAEAGAIAHGIRSHGIPLLSGWGMVVLTLVLLLAGGVVLSRRRGKMSPAKFASR